MHKINVLIYGPDSFISTINELKPFLKFNLINNFKLSENLDTVDFDVLICHEIEYKKLQNI